MADVQAYDRLAALLTYPGPGYHRAAAECRDLLGDTDPAAAADAGNFAARIAGLSVDELRELFTITFDLNPVCTLEVGWHLHGDTYDRGEFLVQMRSLLRETGIRESAELPDHLSHLLEALPRLDPDTRGALAGSAILPALDKMLTPLHDKDNAFEPLLTAVRSVVSAEAPLMPTVQQPGRPDVFVERARS